MSKFFLAATATALFLCLCPPVFAGDPPDTGQTKCYDNSGRIPCPLEGEAFYGQDGHYAKARSYTKLGSGGTVLADTAGDWIMVKDNVTGLVWEVKHAGDGTADYNNPHDADNTYTWYDETFVENPGTAGDGTDTSDFIDALNSANFGGYSDWRMPTVKELMSLVHRGRSVSPLIDTVYFPYCVSSDYWSSTTDAGYEDYAWNVHFSTDGDGSSNKSSSRYVRAVRGGQ